MKVNREDLMKRVSVHLEREAEYTDYRGEFDNETTLAWVREQIEMGNRWAWFSAKVTVDFCGFTSDQYLGGCSYESEENFRACEYFEQLVNDGVAEIVDQLESIMNEHDLWEHDDKSCLWCVVS